MTSAKPENLSDDAAGDKIADQGTRAENMKKGSAACTKLLKGKVHSCVKTTPAAGESASVSTANIGPLHTLDQDLRPQQISLPDPTNMNFFSLFSSGPILCGATVL